MTVYSKTSPSPDGYTPHTTQGQRGEIDAASAGQWHPYDPMRPPEGVVDIWVHDGKSGWPCGFCRLSNGRWIGERGEWAYVPEGASVTHWCRYVGPNGEVMPWR